MHPQTKSPDKRETLRIPSDSCLLNRCCCHHCPRPFATVSSAMCSPSCSYCCTGSGRALCYDYNRRTFSTTFPNKMLVAKITHSIGPKHSNLHLDEPCKLLVKHKSPEESLAKVMCSYAAASRLRISGYIILHDRLNTER